MFNFNRASNKLLNKTKQTIGGFHVTSQALCFRAKTELAE